jgi:hypothetical protein
VGIASALILSDSPVTTQAFRAGFLQLGADLEEAAGERRLLVDHVSNDSLPLLAPIAGAVGL